MLNMGKELKELGVLIKADGEISVEELKQPLHESIGKLVGGYIEYIQLNSNTFGDYCMICDEEFLLKEPRPELNTLATLFYGMPAILGDVVFLKEGFRSGELTLVGLYPEEANMLVEKMRKDLEEITKSKAYLEFLKVFEVENLKPSAQVYEMEFDEDGNIVLGEEL